MQWEDLSNPPADRPTQSSSDWKDILYQSYVSSGHVRNSLGSAEEYLRSRRAYFRAIIRNHFPPDREARVLDIGCGHGALLYFLQQAGYSHTRGVDASVEQVEMSHRLGISGVELGEAQTFIRGCASDSADVVALFDILEHLTRQQAFDLLLEVHRVLSPRGMCIGHVPNAAGIFGTTIRYGDLTHEQAFAASSVRQMFGALRFERVDCFEDKPIVHGAKSLIRRMIWGIGTAPFRLLLAAETGGFGAILSQNLLFVAFGKKPTGTEPDSPIALTISTDDK